MNHPFGATPIYGNPNMNDEPAAKMLVFLSVSHGLHGPWVSRNGGADRKSWWIWTLKKIAAIAFANKELDHWPQGKTTHFLSVTADCFCRQPKLPVHVLSAQRAHS